ncbi:MAG TPA: cytochrome C oxidase subunit I [Burkholderiaceae bacterium]|nr:cytochrome C oxidase subunit I [Burkholderiaceae bacterium]
MTAPGTIGHWRRYRVLYAVIALCAAPVLASYFAYYVMPPSGRSNYGTLLAPAPVPAQPLTTIAGQPFAFSQLEGRWVLVMAAAGACDPSCEDALLQMRQQRLMTGKERDRVERVWLVTDGAPVAVALQRDYEGTYFVRMPLAAARSMLPAAERDELTGQLWLVDPMGNVMLRWPPDPEPRRVKADLSRLLTASSHWVRVERSN